MPWGWWGLALVLAVGDWIAVGLHRPRWRILFKPGMMLALLAGFSLAQAWQGPGVWVGLGLVFSLAGDVLLLLPPRYFIGGLASFLLAHIFYIVAFNQGLPALSWQLFLILAVLAVVDFFGYRRLRRALIERHELRRVRYGVLVYIVVISLMLLSALLTLLRPEWPRMAGILVASGAFLFYISDSVLSNNRFVAPIPGGRLIVIVTYHLAQLAIASAVLILLGLA